MTAAPTPMCKDCTHPVACNRYGCALAPRPGWDVLLPAEPTADARDAARWRALRANTGNEIDLSSGPGSAKAMVIRINVEGCEKWLESGTPDIPATLDAAMDDEVRIQADAARAALFKGKNNEQ